MFRELMQMDPAAMVIRMRTAPKEGLPAQVLARAYHVLSQDGAGGDLAEVAINRLFGGGPGNPPGGAGEPEYMRWLLVECHHQVPRGSRWRDPADLYQGTIRQILRKLRGPGGAIAHTAWRAFCEDRMVDALRERTRKDPPQVGLEAQDPVTGASINLADTVDEFPWHGSTEPDREEEVMAYMRARLEAEKDSRVCEIGLDQFFGDPSPIDRDPSDPRVPLTERYGVDRFKIYRLKQKAKKVLREAFNEWTDMHPRP